MKLPTLPKKNKKKEADFGLEFREWIETNPQFMAPYELKQTDGEDSINFKEVTEEQIRIALLAKSDIGVLIRIEKGTTGAPDYIWLRNSPYWFVIKYAKSFEIIDAETYVLERDRSKRKSLTYERAQAISVLSVK